MLLMLLMAAAHPDPEALRCAVRADRIDITLPVGVDRRIGSMAVVHGKTWAILADEQSHFVPFRSGVRHLVLRASTQLGAVDGQAVRAFPRAGRYRIVFADNLETEPENMIALDCVVKVR